MIDLEINTYMTMYMLCSILQLKLDDLMLSERAKKKMIEIAGSRYVQVGRNNVIRLVGKRYSVMYMYIVQFEEGSMML